MTLALPSSLSRFRWLALFTALAVFALIVMGGVARVTGASLPASPLVSALDWSHRGLAVLAGVAVCVTAAQAWRAYRRVRWIVQPALTGVGLLALQVLLGAALAQLSAPPLLTVLHLAVSLALLGTVIIVAVVAFQLQNDPHIGDALLHFDPLSQLTGATTLGVFILLVLGALVTALGAGGACAGWPLCNGSFLPASALGVWHMAHRYVTLGVSVMLVGAVIQSWRWRRHNVSVPVTAAIVAALFAGQVLVGAQIVVNGFPLFMNGLHFATGVAVWAAMVVLAVLAFQYVRLSPLKFAVPAMRAKLQLRAALADYFALTKPIIMALLLVTTLCAMVVAGHGWPPLDLLLWTMLGGGLASGGASALNQALDRDLDQRMTRTAHRPLADGRVDMAGGLAFGFVLSIASFYILAVFVTPMAAFLAVLGNVYYVVGYTVLLKKSTVQNIVIGGGAGAIPPLVGWAAATGRINLPAMFLFALIFFWTPPHFWALALLKRNDYARAGVPMLPVVWGEAETRWHILLYTLVVVALSLLLTPARVAGWFYLSAAAVLGAVFIAYAVGLYRAGGNKMAWALYKYSSLYLALIFAALVVDRFVSG
jgi:protoheme IX farnesyltransferase